MKSSLLTVDEAAEFIGLSAATIYSAIARQKLPRRYRQGSLIVRESDLAEWQASKSKGGRPKGQPMSDEHKAKLRAAYARRAGLQAKSGTHD